ncbi:MAG TPA: site-2 protease family protein [Terracidiphilus sp.]|nr:site-2 protease family protein [Terracidiphilus sp.]
MQASAFVFAIFEFVLLIFSLSVHECAHAWMASRLGDQTARMQGRITLNPMDHIDPVGSLLFPAIIIFGPFIGFTFFSGLIVGWAKPTPIITRNFRKITRDDNLTTFAGPAANLLLVLIGYLVLVVINYAAPDGHAEVMVAFMSAWRGGVLAMSASSGVQAVALLASLAVMINFSLLFFNLLPIPPLDGSRILRNVLPYNMVQAYDRIPIWVSYLLMFFVGGTIVWMFVRPAMVLVYMALNGL